MSTNTALQSINAPHLPGPAREGQPASLAGLDIGHEFQYWHGASGRRYLHSVYPLIECPEIPLANYVLVRRGRDGSRQPLHTGRTCSETGSLNLALIRRTAARLGANEVHIHVMTDNPRQRREVEHDLRLGLFSSHAIRILTGGNGGHEDMRWPLVASNQNARPED